MQSIDCMSPEDREKWLAEVSKLREEIRTRLNLFTKTERGYALALLIEEFADSVMSLPQEKGEPVIHRFLETIHDTLNNAYERHHAPRTIPTLN